MASRRMVAVRIIDSAKFLKMPSSTRELYFQLITRADDDGVVEAFNIMRVTGATEDDLRLLVAKEYVTILNEDLVTYINDWNEHNLIRSDRKIDSLYKELLVQILPDVAVKQKRKRADSKKELSDGQPMDNQRTTNGQHRLGKDRLGKDRLGKDRKKNTYTLGFEVFWESYPKKIGKKAAFKAWQSARIDSALVEKIMSAIDVAKDSEQWCRNNGQYIPNPATWINQGRWDDEITNVTSRSSNPFKDILKELENEQEGNRNVDGDYQDSISGILPEPDGFDRRG